MKRRTVLTSFLPLLQGGRWLDQLLLVNQGEIVQKRLFGVTDGEEAEVAVIATDGSTVASNYTDLLGESPGEVSTEVARELREEYDTLRFSVTVSHYDTGGTLLGRTGTTEYETSRILYSGMGVGDHISFQTSLLNRNTIISLSCLSSDKSSLQRRCRVGVKDPTEER